MADQFKLEADELAKVWNGLRDIESRMKAAVSRLRGQLGVGGTPWQFPGGPTGVGSNLENAESSIDPLMTGAVADLADYVQKIVNTFEEADR